jgi:hypothetical protein
MKKHFVWYFVVTLMAYSVIPQSIQAEDIILDDFEYEDEWLVYELYSNSGWLGTGEAFPSEESPDGTHSMELYLTFTGEPWGGGAVIIEDQEPFSFNEDQMISYQIKGDPVNLAGDQAILVFQFRDAAGEVIRFLDYVGPKTEDWTTINIPFKAFEEGPWDANPDVAADRENLVNWEFYVQGVGGDTVDPFEATVFIDNLTLTDAPTSSSGDRVLDSFDYEDDAALSANYVSAGALGLGNPTLTDDRVEGTTAMQLDMTFEGGAWGSAGVRSVDQAPFSIADDQVVRYSVRVTQKDSPATRH